MVPPVKRNGGPVLGRDGRRAVAADADAVADEAEVAGLGDDLALADGFVVDVERQRCPAKPGMAGSVLWPVDANSAVNTCGPAVISLSATMS